jgi:cell wall-associated NlpC family hydrolase
MNDVVVEARSWLGTPFAAGASVKSVGADCAGLVEGVARDLGVRLPARTDAGDDLVWAATHSLRQIERVEAGALILIAKDPGGPPLHAAFVTDTETIIHAHWRAGVVENRYGAWFVRRTTHIFAWPPTTSI